MFVRRSEGASGESVEAVGYACDSSAHDRELELLLDAERALKQLNDRRPRRARARSPQRAGTRRRWRVNFILIFWIMDFLISYVRYNRTNIDMLKNICLL